MVSGVVGRRVRAATLADAQALADVHVRGWQAGYRGLLPQAYLDGLDPVERVDRWRQALLASPPAFTTLVLDDDVVGVMGFTSVGACRDPDADVASVGEVAALYVHPDHWRTGGGWKLMAAAVGHLVGCGYREAVLWVLDTNERARRFYESAGWLTDGAAKTDGSRGFPIAEVRYRRALPPS
jgi:ribosomal protein S18 acetylase RimI-like enzyme